MTAYEPVARKKRVLIAGGGVAGCEAARVLAERGHEPVLYEASERLGGNLLPGGAPAFKEDDLQLLLLLRRLPGSGQPCPELYASERYPRCTDG